MTSIGKISIDEQDRAAEIGPVPAGAHGPAPGGAARVGPSGRLLDCAYCGQHTVMVVPLIDGSGNRVGRTVLCTRCDAQRAPRSPARRNAPAGTL
jgi:hypothetical protein